MSKNLMEVREKFIKVLNDPAHLNAGSREIAEAFLNSQRSEISSDAWDEVIIIGLIHMMGSLRRRRPILAGADGTHNLFAGFDIEPIIVVRVVEDGKGPVEKNKDLGSLTLPEALDYVARHSKERAANHKRIREWRRLITRVKPFMTKEGMTLAEGLIAAEEHARDTSKRKAASSR
jgi:hypothetical protein